MRMAWKGNNLVRLGVAVVVASLFLSSAIAKDKRVYKHLVIQPFEVPDDAQFPPDFAAALQHNLVHQLEHTNRFQTMTLLEKGEQPPSDADLILTGKIVRFDKGNRMARYMVPGMGATKIKATVSFTDPATNQSIFQRDVSGKVVIGVFGGDSRGATNGLAKDLAKDVRKDLP